MDSQSVSFGVTKVHYTISEDRTGDSVEQKRRCLAVLTERSYGLTRQVKLDSNVAESPLSLEDFATAVRGPRVSRLEDHAVGDAQFTEPDAGRRLAFVPSKLPPTYLSIRPLMYLQICYRLEPIVSSQFSIF